MPDLTLVWTVLAEHPEQWASAALLFALAAGVVAWTPPERPAANCGCGGDMESCRCGTPKMPTPRPFSGGAR